MSVFYNELDPFPAQWLRNLMDAGHIPAGTVDERSIEEIEPETVGDTAHFFAGIGGWPHALRLAGVPDNAGIWTGSCPCQPFSSAGRGREFSDRRHLWPAWFRLIRERRPSLVFGEQVAGRAGERWLDLVQADMEAVGYTFGAVVLPAASVGAPHGRHRIFFGAHAQGLARRLPIFWGRSEPRGAEPVGSGEAVSSADADDFRRRAGHGEAGSSGSALGIRPGAVARDDGEARSGANSERDTRGPGRAPVESRESDATPRSGSHDEPGRRGDAGERDDAERAGLEGQSGHVGDGDRPGWLDQESVRSAAAAGATRGHWAGCDWWYGRDGKWRPTQPGVFPLAHGIPGRVGRLRAYGNAIVPQVAARFVSTFLECVR